MGKKLYVGNLSWTTTEGSLQETFAQAGEVVSAQIPLNDMGKSRGFGFVEMATDEDAVKAIELFNEKDLDGRVIRVNEAGQAPAGGSGSVNERKLFVGNLSWRTSEDDLRNSFAEAGSVTYVKVPLNDQGKSRGIGFVEMATNEEAQAAIAMWNEKDVDGRPITVNVARPQAPRPRYDEGGGNGGGGGYNRDRGNSSGGGYNRDRY